MGSNKILYFEAPDGISGDMTLGALIDLVAPVYVIKNELGKIIKGDFDLIPHPFKRSGINGVSLEVLASEDLSDEDEGLHDHVHEYHYFHGGAQERKAADRDYSEIKSMITGSRISKRAKTYALQIFHTIAEAESAVHDIGTEKVTFHEIGALDSIIDIVGTAIAIDVIGVTEFYTSAVNDGSGTIECRHGLIPVPVPAVVEMAKNSDIPIIINADVNTEMVTPTGFAILKGLGAKFEPRLGIRPEKTGYGFGKCDTGRLAAVRVTLGELYKEEE
jgi:uncharacterized protein (TIGR00299 family) protein